MSKKKITNPADCKFEADGKIYGFIYPQIKVQIGGTYKVLTAIDLVTRKDDETAEVLANLVESGSGAIKCLGDAKQEPKAPSKKKAAAPKAPSKKKAAGDEDPAKEPGAGDEDPAKEPGDDQLKEGGDHVAE